MPHNRTKEPHRVERAEADPGEEECECKAGVIDERECREARSEAELVLEQGSMEAAKRYSVERQMGFRPKTCSRLTKNQRAFKKGVESSQSKKLGPK